MTAAGPASRPVRPLGSWLEQHADELIAIRRNLHAHPELSGEEHATTELIADHLERAGLRPRRLAVGTGLVCDLGGGRPGAPTFALRADLDALAMHDEKDVPYRSQVRGVAHACGHDVHTTVMLGTALYFAHHRDDVPGPLRFVFQPAEERVPGGALDVIGEGGLDGVDAIVGIHCDPKAEVGTVGLRPGPISSAADMATITLTGPGGHTARPELTVDMVALGARVVAELPARVEAMLDDPSRLKLVFGSISAGDAANVIPARCELRASVRTPSIDVWEALPQLVDRALTELLADSDADYELEYIHGVPPVVNDARLTEIVQRAAAAELGDAAITPAIQSWGGDDFAWFGREVAATYVRMGVHDPSHTGPRLDLHAGQFDVDERVIALGVRVMVATVEAFFAAEVHRGAVAG